MKRLANAVSGGIIVWKPVGITSRRGLEIVERRLGTKPLGHTGTLDPLAAGILVLLGGEARKFQDYLMSRSKVYVARIVLGMNSASDDAEGPLWCPVPARDLPTAAEIENHLQPFLGSILQTPPQVSAVRLDGVRAYRRARRGENPRPRPRRVETESVRLLAWEPPVLHLRVECGAGFYVRSLARDLGEALGVGGFLAGLRRTEVGNFTEADAAPIASAESGQWRTTEELLVGAPRVEVDDGMGARLSHGQRVPARNSPPGRAVVWCQRRVLGLADVREGQVFPRRWLNPDY